ncbi:MAG: trypsin-like peptidase domain-containing protein, partial [Opitutaceae bacterium]
MPLPSRLFALVGFASASFIAAHAFAAESLSTIAPVTVSPAPAGSVVENSVVRIFATTRAPDLAKPWAKASPREVAGTGIVIDNKRILTNAHVVSFASQVQIQANQSGEKLAATVEYIAPGIDLAVLKLD